MNFEKCDLSNPLAVKARKEMVSAIADYNMLQAGDKVLVAVSGGKDSSILLMLLNEVRRRAHFDFTISAVMLDQKQPGFDPILFRQWVEAHDISLTILEQDTYSIVTDKVPEGKTFCALCSRLRRGILYNYAHEQGFTKIALGHHSDDLLETALLNLFYASKLSSMPPKLKSDDGRNILIRPLAYVQESDLIKLAQEWAFPVIPCNLCGSQENLKRKKMKQLISKLENDNPSLRKSMLNALGNVRPSQLMDKNLFNFENLGL